MGITTPTEDRVSTTSVQGREAGLSKLRGILLRALAFEILLGILTNVIGALLLLGATIGMATEDRFTGVTLYFGYLADGIPLVFLATGVVISILVAARTWRMLNAANAGDVVTLQRVNSLGWAILALIFGWVVPGVFLIGANEPIKQL